MLSFSLVVTPLMCGNKCKCYFSHDSIENIMNCSFEYLAEIPRYLLPSTDVLVMSNGNMGTICNELDISHLKSLNLKNNNIIDICDVFIERISESNLKQIDLSNNQLVRLSGSFKHLRNLETLLLSGNPFICDCDTIWMSNWLVNFTTTSGSKIVKDYKNITCYSGKMIGTHVYLLNSWEMGCYQFASWKIAVIAIVGIMVIITIILATVVIKRSKEARWIIYKNFNKLIQVEENEDITGYEFDAFVSYRFMFIFIQTPPVSYTKTRPIEFFEYNSFY